MKVSYNKVTLPLHQVAFMAMLELPSKKKSCRHYSKSMIVDSNEDFQILRQDPMTPVFHVRSEFAFMILLDRIVKSIGEIMLKDGCCHRKEVVE